MRPIITSIVALLFSFGCGDIVNNSTEPDASIAPVDGGAAADGAPTVDADTRVEMLDQTNLVSDGNSVCSDSQTVGQTFVVSASGLLTGIEVAAVRCQAAETDIIQIEVSLDGSTPTDTLQITGAGLLGPGQCGVIPAALDAAVMGPAHFDVRDLGLEVNPDERYQFTLTCPSADDFRIGTSGDVYADGTGQANGSPVARDTAFKIFVAR